MVRVLFEGGYYLRKYGKYKLIIYVHFLKKILKTFELSMETTCIKTWRIHLQCIQQKKLNFFNPMRHVLSRVGADYDCNRNRL